jgi:hypothetical protein
MTPDERTSRSLVESDLDAFRSTLDDPAAFRSELRALLAAEAAARGRALPRRQPTWRGRPAAIAVAAVGLLAVVAVALLSGSSALPARRRLRRFSARRQRPRRRAASSVTTSMTSRFRRPSPARGPSTCGSTAAPGRSGRPRP